MGADPQLSKIVDYLVATEAQVALGTFGTAQRPWVNFSTIQKAGKFNFKAVDQIFSRTASNTSYTTDRQSKDTLSKDLQTAKLSGDYLAGCCRDYKMRTRSRIRMLVHGGNRAAANGLGEGPLMKNTIGWLGRIESEDAK